jgi:hypothetical protein
MFFSLLVSYIRFLGVRDPNIPRKTMIDYNLVLVSNSSQTLGSTIGAIVTTMLPDLVILILLQAVVIVSFSMTLVKTV